MPTSTGPQYEFIGSEALQRQIELLKYYPEIFDKYFFPALERSADLVKGAMRPNIPSRRVRAALGSKVTHSRTSALGTRAIIGFGKRFGMPSARFAAPLNQGAAAHKVVGKLGTGGFEKLAKDVSKNYFKTDAYLHFSSGGGTRFTTIGSIQHPGFAGRHFMEAGLEDAKPGIDNLLEQAAGQVVQELAKP